MKKYFNRSTIAAASLFLIVGSLSAGQTKTVEQLQNELDEMRKVLRNDAEVPHPVVLDDLVIPNSPLLRPNRIMTIHSTGMGVAPEVTSSPAQALALAKRAAIVDAYRQLGEKMYGIRIDAKDTIKDMMLKDSKVQTRLLAVIRNAEIIEVNFSDGLCEVTMELKLDAKRWYRILNGMR